MHVLRKIFDSNNIGTMWDLEQNKKFRILVKIFSLDFRKKLEKFQKKKSSSELTWTFKMEFPQHEPKHFPRNLKTKIGF